MTTYNNLTLDELKNEAERSDNTLARAIMSAQDNDDSQDEYIEELEAAIAEHLSGKIEESLNGEKRTTKILRVTTTNTCMKVEMMSMNSNLIPTLNPLI